MKHFSKPRLCLVALMVSGFLFGGCNDTPNTNSSDGPTILLSLSPVDRDFTWPPGTPTNLINSGNNNLQLLATTANQYQTYKWLPPEAKPPNYDWRVGIAPADASGIRYFDAVIGRRRALGALRDDITRDHEEDLHPDPAPVRPRRQRRQRQILSAHNVRESAVIEAVVIEQHHRSGGDAYRIDSRGVFARALSVPDRCGLAGGRAGFARVG